MKRKQTGDGAAAASDGKNGELEIGLKTRLLENLYKIKTKSCSNLMDSPEAKLSPNKLLAASTPLFTLQYSIGLVKVDLLITRCLIRHRDIDIMM